MTRKIKVLSLFDGIGGARQALKELGIDCEYYASEVDKYAIKVAKHNHPDIIELGDVKELEVSIEPFDWKDVFKKEYLFDSGGCLSSGCNTKNMLHIPHSLDLLIGGSPCQDLSIAKKDRKGLDGDRSGLFYEYVRILKEVKPKHFILENVASMSKASRDVISAELGVKPVLINSSLLTAQQRKRYYWVGTLQEDGTYKQVEIPQPQDKGILLKDIIESGISPNIKSGCLTATYHKSSGLRDYLKGGRQVVAEPVKLGHFNKGGQGDRIYSVEGKRVSLLANGGGRGAKTGLYKIDLPDGDYNIRKLTVNECCRLQGFPDGYCEAVSNTQGYKGLGNSFTVPVIKHIINQLVLDND